MEPPTRTSSSHGSLHFPGSNFHSSFSPPASSHSNSQRRSWRSPSKLFSQSRRPSGTAGTGTGTGRARNEAESSAHVAVEQTPRAYEHESSNPEPKWWRIRLFRGMIDDVKRRAPYYWSDWADAWDYRVVPATVYMYFAKYGRLLAHRPP
jgi:hypothetical protein